MIKNAVENNRWGKGCVFPFVSGLGITGKRQICQFISRNDTDGPAIPGRLIKRYGIFGSCSNRAVICRQETVEHCGSLTPQDRYPLFQKYEYNQMIINKIFVDGHLFKVKCSCI